MGWGACRGGTDVQHLTTPTPDPSPQGGGEQCAATSKLKLTPMGASLVAAPPAQVCRTGLEKASMRPLENGATIRVAPKAG
jgi:hypothetical protein